MYWPPVKREAFHGPYRIRNINEKICGGIVTTVLKLHVPEQVNLVLTQSFYSVVDHSLTTDSLSKKCRPSRLSLLNYKYLIPSLFGCIVLANRPVMQVVNPCYNKRLWYTCKISVYIRDYIQPHRSQIITFHPNSLLISISQLSSLINIS